MVNGRFSLAICILTHFVHGNVFSPFTSKVYVKNEQFKVMGNRSLRLSMGVKVKNFRQIETHFYAVSDPENVLYGHFLDKEQVNRLVEAERDSVRKLVNWLENSQLARDVQYHESSVVISWESNVSEVELLLNTSIAEFKNGNHRVLRAEKSMVVSEEIQSLVSFISLNVVPVGKQNGRMLQATGTFSTPKDLRELYGIPKNRKVQHVNCTQGTPAFYDECYSMNDLYLFTNYTNGTYVPKVEQRGNRVNDQHAASGEASLDVQYLTALAPNAKTIVWTVNGTNPYSVIDEPFVEWANMVLATEDVPYVISISYSDDEGHVYEASAGYARHFDILLMKMGLRGISVFIAAGDDGVAGQRPSIQKLTPVQGCETSGPQWPSGSPYITSVGATMQFQQNADDVPHYFQTNQEVVCSSNYSYTITSGGGFANAYATPPYQKAQVDHYITKHCSTLPESFFNRSGRGYPDITALGTSYLVYYQGIKRYIAGTSASTPLIASMTTLWNDRRLLAGKPPLGFLNPALYYLSKSNTSAFNDITIGNNAAYHEGYQCHYSFQASPGWDAASGVGSPNFLVLDDLFFHLPNISPNSPFQAKIQKLAQTHPFVLPGVFLGLVAAMMILQKLYQRSSIFHTQDTQDTIPLTQMDNENSPIENSPIDSSSETTENGQ